MIKTNEEDAETLFEQLTQEIGSVILEEVVKSHPSIARFNPDSVNTVRLVTYYDGEDVHFPFVTMRFGMKGSFVDNAGSGGVSVLIDPETGCIISDGYRQNGTTCTTHPDSGITFKGTQLPNWEKALELGREIAKRLPGVRYVGWDIAFNDKEEWVVIEGNPMAQLIGIQMISGTGRWKSFYDMFMECKSDDVYDKAYFMPYYQMTPTRRDKHLSKLSDETGITYEEVYYKAMRAYAYNNIPFEAYADEKLILKDETE